MHQKTLHSHFSSTTRSVLHVPFEVDLLESEEGLVGNLFRAHPALGPARDLLQKAMETYCGIHREIDFQYHWTASFLQRKVEHRKLLAAIFLTKINGLIIGDLEIEKVSSGIVAVIKASTDAYATPGLRSEKGNEGDQYDRNGLHEDQNNEIGSDRKMSCDLIPKSYIEKYFANTKDNTCLQIEGPTEVYNFTSPIAPSNGVRVREREIRVRGFIDEMAFSRSIVTLKIEDNKRHQIAGRIAFATDHKIFNSLIRKVYAFNKECQFVLDEFKSGGDGLSYEYNLLSFEVLQDPTPSLIPEDLDFCDECEIGRKVLERCDAIGP